ncbi:MAG: aspartate-semialdehyde dehydrogenase [bacterium]
MKPSHIAIVGATGMVGRMFMSILEQRDFPLSELRLLASPRSAGQKIAFRGQEKTVHVLDRNSFDGIDIALFSAGAPVSKEFAPIATDSGATVIDNSSAWRMHDNVPLVVPEVNPEALAPEHKLIANPNCSTIQTVMALKPLHDAAGMKRLVISTYQSVSGKGKAAVDEMVAQSKCTLDHEEITCEVFPHPIAFNMLPHIDVFLDDGYTKEEHKMVDETRKIMAVPALPVSATCVRVPVHTGHCVTLNLEFESPFSPTEARNSLEAFPGVVVMDDPENDLYPTPAFAAGKDDVFVGRIRQDPSVKNGLNLWVVSDNLRKGAALNTIQIAELLLGRTKPFSNDRPATKH